MTSAPQQPAVPTLDPLAAFRRYEEIRSRLPATDHVGAQQQISGLDQIADQVDLFVFDAFGVLNVGDQRIPGARTRIRQLRDLGKRVVVLTNAASFTRPQTQAKFQRLGFDFRPSEIISSREVCERHLAEAQVSGVWGVMAPADFDPQDMAVPTVALRDDAAAYDAAGGFLLLSTADWTAERQDLLQASLERNPRPVVVANPDLVAPRESGLSLEPGFHAHQLQDDLGLTAIYHGKPFASVYQAVTARHPDIDPQRIAMVGDTLHTDVLGAQAQGWQAVLITDHGLFAGFDTAQFITSSGITPDWIAPSI